ncbi:MAG: hypothetical protein V8S95_07590 [Odoribacter sp.]
MACIFSWNIGAFICFRFLQGIAGAGGEQFPVQLLQIVTQGKSSAKAFAMISAVNGLAPHSAPVGGGVPVKIY